MKDDSNNVLTDSTDAMNRWKEYREKLYENPNRKSEHPVVINSMIHEPLPFVAEVEKALNSLKNNKSPRYDEIPYRVIENIMRECNKIYAQTMHQNIGTISMV